MESFQRVYPISIIPCDARRVMVFDVVSERGEDAVERLRPFNMDTVSTTTLISCGLGIISGTYFSLYSLITRLP